MLSSKLLIVATLLGCAESVYFELGYGQRTCFQVEVGRKPTSITGRWSAEKKGGTISVNVEDTRRNSVLTGILDDDEGSFAFTTKGDAGSYEVCLQTSGNRMPMKTTLELATSERATTNPTPKSITETSQYADKRELEEFEKMASVVSAEVVRIAADAGEFRYRMEVYQKIADGIGRTVWWLGLLQVTVLIGLGVGQSVLFKNFLFKKKIV
ncbi:Protein ERP6 [Diplonema papillatum]|nr:Protein ERP6 [Diplonema papillatum]